MDLLLYLIQKDNLDIYDIPIAKITSKYLEYLNLLKEMNLEVAGDFLIMAATLMKIKSKMLLPAHENENGEDIEDPRDEIAKRLLEYKKFKEASKILKDNLDQQKDIFFRKIQQEFVDEDYRVDVSLFDLMCAFKKVLEKAKIVSKEIIKEEFTIEEKIRIVLSLLEGKKFVSFYTIFSDDESKHSIIVTFLALLELMKTGRIYVKQDKYFTEIRIYRTQIKSERGCA
ncbi:MAG: segregation/condensation protein A [Elusimicrobiota bacterium]